MKPPLEPFWVSMHVDFSLFRNAVSRFLHSADRRGAQRAPRPQKVIKMVPSGTPVASQEVPGGPQEAPGGLRKPQEAKRDPLAGAKRVPGDPET